MEKKSKRLLHQLRKLHIKVLFAIFPTITCLRKKYPVNISKAYIECFYIVKKKTLVKNENKNKKKERHIIERLSFPGHM